MLSFNALHTDYHGWNQEPIYLPNNSGFNFRINLACVFADQFNRGILI